MLVAFAVVVLLLAVAVITVAVIVIVLGLDGASVRRAHARTPRRRRTTWRPVAAPRPRPPVGAASS